MQDEKIKNSSELEFAVFCIENVAAKPNLQIYFRISYKFF